ncbi:hypothetical protein BaRGS_00024236, partial [Batillaria attramentaria]
MSVQTRKSTAADVDALLEALGPMKKYEVLQLTVYSLGHLACAFQLFGIVFVGQDVSHTCSPPTNLTSSGDALNLEPFEVASPRFNVSYDPVHQRWPSEREQNNFSIGLTYGKCKIYSTHIAESGNSTSTNPCVFGYSYTGSRESSVVSEFDLVCNRAPLLGLSQTLLIIGQGVGSFLLPAMADRWGRKRMHIIAQALLFASGIGLAFAPNFIVFAVMKFVVGCGQIGARLTNMTATVELFPARYRARVAAVFSGIVWACCMAVMSPLAYWVRFESWRVLQLVLTSTSLLGIVQLLILDEPIRWLLANNKQPQALKAIRGASRLNKRNADSLEEHVRSLMSSPNDKVANSGNFTSREAGKVKGENLAAKRIGAVDILKHGRMRVHVVGACVLWFVNSFTYFALFLTSSSLAGDKYVNFVLLAVVEIPSCIVYSFTLDRYGRKPTLIMFHALAGVGLIASCICQVFAVENSTIAALSTALSMVGKFGVTGSLNVTFAYTTELFPTNCRNLGLGAASAAGRLGGMISPFAGLL